MRAYLNDPILVGLGVIFLIALCIYILVIDQDKYHKTPIGLGRDIARDQSHGFIWVTGKQGGIDKIPFQAKQPGLLRIPTIVTVNDIFSQAESMNFQPHMLEIIFEGKRTVYKKGKTKPVMIDYLRPT